MKPLSMKLERLWNPDNSAEKLMPRAEYPKNFNIPYSPFRENTFETEVRTEIMDSTIRLTILILISDRLAAVSLASHSGPNTI